MSLGRYWTGANLDLNRIWMDFEEGQAYVSKFNLAEVHMIRFTFSKYSSADPIFNHEAIFHTIKGYFHEVKKTCFTFEEYDASVPVFLYSINRNSEEWSFLGELRQLLLVGTTLSDEKALGQVIENYEKKLAFINKNFPASIGTPEFMKFMEANSAHAVDAAVKNLINQKLMDIEISRRPFRGDEKKIEWISLKKLQGD